MFVCLCLCLQFGGAPVLVNPREPSPTPLASHARCGRAIAVKSAHLHVKESIAAASRSKRRLLLSPGLCVCPCEAGTVRRFSSVVRNFWFFFRPQRQRLIRARVSPEEGGGAAEESSGADRTTGEGDLQPQEEERGREAAGGRAGGAQHKGEVEDEDGEDEDAPFKPFVLPGKWRKKKNGLLESPNVNLSDACKLFFGFYPPKLS